MHASILLLFYTRGTILFSQLYESLQQWCVAETGLLSKQSNAGAALARLKFGRCFACRNAKLYYVGL